VFVLKIKDELHMQDKEYGRLVPDKFADFDLQIINSALVRKTPGSPIEKGEGDNLLCSVYVKQPDQIDPSF
jgi:hypothetical protein